jgi:hypothetical protein
VVLYLSPCGRTIRGGNGFKGGTQIFANIIPAIESRWKGLDGARIQLGCLDEKQTYAAIDDHTVLLRGRKLRSRQIDVKLIQKWIQICEDCHGDACQMKEAFQPTEAMAGFHLIGVTQQCGVPYYLLPSRPRYVALSYIWGNVKQLVLNKNTAEKIQLPGALHDPSIVVPTTIKDAMRFYEMIGESYLWVDALCIRQGDEVGRTDQIDSMNIIYQSAILTIVVRDFQRSCFHQEICVPNLTKACAGDDANAPLPGVSLLSRFNSQYEAVVQGVQLMTMQPHLQHAVGPAKWNTRGWTYQETILLKQLLFFCKEQCFFRCSAATWYEDTHLETLTGHTRAEVFVGSPDPVPQRPPAKSLNDNEYAELVSECIQREFTVEPDRLAGFCGIRSSYFNGKHF